MKPAATEVEHAALRLLMRRCGYDWSHVSRLSGIPVSTLRWQCCRGFSRMTRARLESAFGIPIFSSPSVWRERQVRKAILGVDPELIGRNEMRAIARRTGFVGWGHSPNKAKFLRDLCAFLAVNRHIHPLTPEAQTPSRHD